MKRAAGPFWMLVTTSQDPGRGAGPTRLEIKPGKAAGPGLYAARRPNRSRSRIHSASAPSRQVSFFPASRLRAL